MCHPQLAQTRDVPGEYRVVFHTSVYGSAQVSAQLHDAHLRAPWIDHQRQLHDRPLKGSLVLVHSHASLLELVPVPQPKLRTSPGFSHLL